MRPALGRLAPLGLAAVGAAACTTLLGDFSVGTPFTHTEGGTVDAARIENGTTPPRDANDADMFSLDATAGDAAASGDGAGSDDAVADVEAGLPQLKCATWKWPNPIVVEDLSSKATRRFGGRYAAFPAQVDEVRIVASKNGAPAYSVYTVTKSTMQVQQLDGNPPGLAFVADIHHVSAGLGGTTAVVIHESPISPPGSYYVVAFNDLMASTGPLPAQFALFSQTLGQSVSSLHVFPFSTTDIFEAVSLSSGNPPTYTFGVARASPSSPSSASTLSSVATSVNANDFAIPRMLHANGNMYISDLNDISTPGCSAWTVPDTAVLSSMPTKQVIASGTSIGVYDMSPNGLAPAANILAIEEDFAGQFTSGYKFSVGVVPYTNLGSWTTAGLAQVRRTTAFGAPVGVPPNASWFGDDIMVLGPGLRNGADGGMAPGLNVLWLNASGAIRCDHTGPNSILNDRADFAMAAAVPARIATNTAAWDIVWVETVTDADGGTHDIMKMNELLCL